MPKKIPNDPLKFNRPAEKQSEDPEDLFAEMDFDDAAFYEPIDLNAGRKASGAAPQEETGADEDEMQLDEPEEEVEEPSARRPLFSFLKLRRGPAEDDIPDEAEEESDEEEELPEEEEKEPLNWDAVKARFSGLAKILPTRMTNSEMTEDEPAGRSRSVTVARDKSFVPVTVQDLPREPAANEMLVYDSELDDIDLIDSEDLPERRDYLPIRFRRYGTLGISGGLLYAIFVISLSIVLACAGWMFAADVLALSKDYTESVVTVEPYVPKEGDLLNGDGEAVDEEGNVITCDIDQVAAALHDGDIINFEFLFKLFSKVSHAYYKIDPGTYDVSTNLDYRALVTEMQTGSDSQQVTRITFPEGYTMAQIFAKLEENGICDAEDLYEAAAEHDFSYSWLEDIPLGEATRLEGYLFPDTYDFYQGEHAISVLNRFLLRFHSIITADMYQQAENQGVSLHEAVIIASLIEKEAGPEDDRANFSSVIYKRLRNDWPLQLDSTINYINNTSTFNITYADMETDSPYNTYLYSGLPAGPICSPGLASLNAALNPNDTDYWFWYAYDGISYFFSDSGDFDDFAAEHPVE